jgi:hypothetical protein
LQSAGIAPALFISGKRGVSPRKKFTPEQRARRIRRFIEARRSGAAELPFRPEEHLD